MLEIINVCPHEEWIIVKDLLGKETQYDLYNTNDSDLKAIYLGKNFTQKVIINLKMRTLKDLDSELSGAFQNSNYSLCKELIELGANREVILKVAKNIKSFNRTMSQDNILEDLVLNKK